MAQGLNLHTVDLVIAEAPGLGILQIARSGAPTESAAGFATGCIYQDIANGAVYKNTGSVTTATWVELSTGE